MKLSEAIREGSKLSIQGFGGLGEGAQTCALGAAGEWVWYETGGAACLPQGNWTLLPLVDAVVHVSPCGCEFVCAGEYGLGSYYDNSVAAIIAHLNDTHKWSREAIAEWVEVIENKLEQERAAFVSSADASAVEAKPQAAPPVSV